MEQNNETTATGSRRLSRVFTKKRLGGLAAVIAGAAVADISPTAERRREHGYFQRYAAGQRF